jgi:hypothetical protein
MSAWKWSIALMGFGAAAAGATADYLNEVKPLLTQHCVGCHGADQQKGGLRLDTAGAARTGGDSGPALIPGNPGDSLLLQLIEGTHAVLPQMPYRRVPLPKVHVEALRRWIAQGAEAPADEPSGRWVHWAFVPPRRPAIPPMEETGGRHPNPIDAFIAARLREEALPLSLEADRSTLLRRLHLDLTGLPPSPEQLDAFLRDPRPEAYECRVDELLHSPHYGERWGRWWLDVARYADSNGYSIDAPRSMWLWRDWVIQAFNDNKPFDEFVIEQIAGDLLPDATLAQRIATGFHRNTQINEEGGIDPEQFRVESIIDRVNTTGTAFLGITLGCAQCHDHKFDPISQKEYFQLFAFFNDQEEPTLSVPTPEEKARLENHQAAVRNLEQQLAELESAADEDAEKARGKLREQLEKLKRRKPSVTTTLVLAERSEPRESYVFIKGDFTRRGPDVSPGTPAVLHPLAAALHAGDRGTGDELQSTRRPNRLDLARWLVDPCNPLTARVLINRVWQQYFGRGLVETENDFGTQGSLPSHPELLDWLATEWLARDWNLRAMHRLIVTSRTYRQTSRARRELEEKDPLNRLLARQNRLRLDAEVIRDVALVASGKLNPEIGGPGVFPPQPDGVMNLGQVRRPWKTSEEGDRYRRGLYTFYWRATPYPALAVFDAPDAFSTCTRRARSNTPLQALTLLNDSAFVEVAVALAERVRKACDDAGERLDLAFRLCLAREPSAAERGRLESLLEEENRDHGEAAAWQTVARVLLNLDETITRE